ncbi:MAG: hypothetical protein U1E14_18305 [Geminicoccaceae bacterium]
MRDDERIPIVSLAGASALAPGGGRLDGASLDLHAGDLVSTAGWGPASAALVGVLSGRLRLRQGSMRPRPAPVAHVREDGHPLPGATLAHGLAAAMAARQGSPRLWLRSPVGALGGKVLDEALHALERTGLAELAERPGSRLNRLEQLLARLALATAVRQRVLLLDRVGEGLEPPSTRRLAGVMRSLAADGCAFLLAECPAALGEAAGARVLPSPVAVRGG